MENDKIKEEQLRDEIIWKRLQRNCMNVRDQRKNCEGYSDPTPYEAITEIEKEERRFRRLLHTIFYICEMAGFEIDGRIVLIDKRNGRIWK